MTQQKFLRCASANGEAVLLVEDNGDDVLLTTLALQKTRPGPLVNIADNGEEGIRYLKGEGIYADRVKYPFPNLVLLDIRTPRKSGFEVLQWIRKQPALSHLPVIVFSGSSESGDVQQSYQNGANSFLRKPGQFEDWVELLDTTLTYWTRMHQVPFTPGLRE